jgi:hypothetical protein
VQLECPQLYSYPPGVQIPVVLIVTTTTKTMKKEDTPHDAFAEHPDKALFPAPPSTAADIVFRLDQSLRVYARGEQESGTDDIATLGGFSDANDASVRIVRGEPAWIPDAAKGGDHGHWKRQVFFNTTILLDYAPTIMVQNIACTVCIFPTSIRSFSEQPTISTPYTSRFRSRAWVMASRWTCRFISTLG